jgi:hypothetical protein
MGRENKEEFSLSYEDLQEMADMLKELEKIVEIRKENREAGIEPKQTQVGRLLQFYDDIFIGEFRLDGDYARFVPAANMERSD